MSTLEIVLMWILIPFRFIVMGVSIITPIILLVTLIYSIFKQRHKRVYLCMLCLLVSFGLIYLVFADIEVPARVNIESIETNKEVILSLEYGDYEFDTGCVKGQLSVYEAKEFESYEPILEINKTYDIDESTICAVSSVFCDKDKRLSHAFEPTISSGTILIENNKKIIEISYYYDYQNIAILLWPITNPEIVYRPQIDVGEIVQSVVSDGSKGQSGGAIRGRFYD